MKEDNNCVITECIIAQLYINTICVCVYVYVPSQNKNRKKKVTKLKETISV